MNSTSELEIVEPSEARLVEYAGKTGLESTATTPLVAAFRPVFANAKVALASADGVAASVKDATCVSEIKKARECRLAIRKVRLAGEAVRKAQKATALAYSKAVDGFYNILEADLAPVEKALQDAEDTAERAEQARKDALESGRKVALAPYVADVALYAVRDMAEPAFAALLAGCRLAKEQSEAAAKKAEQDRIEKEKAEAAERERIRAENERLHKEAVELEAKAKQDREAAEASAAKERAARAKAEAEAKSFRDAQAKQLADEAAAARKAASAPEREKLITLAARFRNLELPTMETEAGKGAIEAIRQGIEGVAKIIERSASNL